MRSTSRFWPSSLERQARERWERLQSQKASQQKAPQPVPSLLDFIPQVSPRFQAPRHLTTVATKLEAFRREPFELVFSVPPRHGKSELCLHFIVWALKQYPWLNICYVSYNADQAEHSSRRALQIAQDAGLQLKTKTAGRWATFHNRVVLWCGIDGPVTGKGFDLILVDDPVKNRAEAESPRMRERAWQFYQNDLQTRLMPGGSFICVQTRFHEDDLAGRLTRSNDEDFEPMEAVNIPAILDEGTEHERSLWPEMWPLPALYKRRNRVGEYSWASLFMGRPVPRGSTVFGEPSFFDELPFAGYQHAQGLDLSYTEKTTSDYSAVVTMRRTPDPRMPGEHLYYVEHVFRAQKRAPDFKADLHRERARAPRSRCRIYAAGTELGAIDFMRRADRNARGETVPGVRLEVIPPAGDKFTRAIPLAAAWNAGRVLLPSPELMAQDETKFGWVNDYLDELRAFSGIKDPRDDQVDATVAAFDILATPSSGYSSMPKVESPRRM